MKKQKTNVWDNFLRFNERDFAAGRKVQHPASSLLLQTCAQDPLAPLVLPPDPLVEDDLSTVFDAGALVETFWHQI